MSVLSAVPWIFLAKTLTGLSYLTSWQVEWSRWISACAGWIG